MASRGIKTQHCGMQPLLHVTLLPLFSILLLLMLHMPQEIQTTPVPVRKSAQTDPCAHKSIAELIRTSPVIVKALGARIFSADGDEEQMFPIAAATTTTTTSGSNKSTAKWPKKQGSAKISAILITLTPETIYKGASLLKMTPGHGGGGDSGGGGSSGSNSNSGLNDKTNAGGDERGFSGSNGNNNAESAYQYEGQLNATLEPLACFDDNMLKMLPMELIAFGKLLPATQLRHQQHQLEGGAEEGLQLQQPQQHEGNVIPSSSSSSSPSAAKDILQISINGLHRWTPQFEHHIWKHLGWDDWSDFTLCSVTCGKGVQQRFRRCLLDNPMVNMNMNLNLNDIDDVDVDEDVDEAAAAAEEDNAYERQNVADNKVTTTTTATSELTKDNAQHKFKQTKTYVLPTKTHVPHDAADNAYATSSTTEAIIISPTNSEDAVDVDVDADGVTSNASNRLKLSTESNWSTQRPSDSNAEADVDINEHKSVTFVQHDDANDVGYVMSRRLSIQKSTSQSSSQPSSATASASGVEINSKNLGKHKKHKSAKSLSTLFCEGYNIEQRNCNTFECSDDINDLLKFYKKLPMMTYDGVPMVATGFSSTLSSSSSSSVSSISSISSSIITSTWEEGELGAASSASSAAAAAAAAAASLLSSDLTSSNVMPQPSSTPSNMGYVRSWRNPLNFTLMITVRAKSDTNNVTATIFSIRNATHNLYLEACKEGLRLYLERDKTTEMLAVKFNLYDYRWHQVAISIQNGDFISIYVDCSWTNSFVVSKRLYSLPLDADVEIGRGFNGELQQLLVLPEHEERQQCSNKRTSINEVKRYIIDTFIDDYSN